MTVLVVKEAPVRGHQSIYNRNASIERKLRDQRRRQLTIGIAKLHHSIVFIGREAIQYHTVVTRLLNRIMDRLSVMQVNRLRQD